MATGGSTAWCCFAIYTALYLTGSNGHSVPVLEPFQQTFLSVAMVGLIAATLNGLRGPLAWLLEHPVLQHIARISYSLYLFHNLVPMALGAGGVFRTHNVSRHTRTNVDVIQRFLDVDITIEKEDRNAYLIRVCTGGAS